MAKHTVYSRDKEGRETILHYSSKKSAKEAYERRLRMKDYFTDVRVNYGESTQSKHKKMKEELMGYEGDHIGLIHIAALIPSFRRKKKRK